MRVRWVVVAFLCLGALACRHQNPYAMKKEFQANQAKHLRPAELRHGDGAWHAFRTMKVRVYADAVFAKKEGNVRSNFAERLERANQVLEPALRLRLVLTEVRELPKEAGATDLNSMLAALRRIDAGEDVDFVVALIGVAPVVTLSFHELGWAQIGGKHIVLRAMDDIAELRAFEQGLDELSPSERSRLYEQRKRHKETAVLLHEVGHALGALHVKEAFDLMHPSYDKNMQKFAGPNLELMGYVISERLVEPSQRDFAALATRIEDYLTHSQWPGWIEDERQSYLAELKAAMQRTATTQAGRTAPPPRAKAAAVQEDLTALSEPDRARYSEIESFKQAERWADAYQTANDLAASYPDSYAVQQKACELGMQLGRPYREVRPACDRMATLAAKPAH